MVGWSIRTFAGMPEIDEIVAVTEPDSLEAMRDLVAALAPERAARVVQGGASRQASVNRGLRAVSADCDGVLVHDGARPLVKAGDVRAGMREVRPGRGALLASAVVDTIKIVDGETMCVTKTLDRAVLWAAQTPQFAMTVDLRRAHDQALRDGVDATDDAALLEAAGVEVVVVASSGQNFKVTMPDDVDRAEALLLRAITLQS